MFEQKKIQSGRMAIESVKQEMAAQGPFAHLSSFKGKARQEEVDLLMLEKAKKEIHDDLIKVMASKKNDANVVSKAMRCEKALQEGDIIRAKANLKAAQEALFNPTLAEITMINAYQLSITRKKGELDALLLNLIKDNKVLVDETEVKAKKEEIASTQEKLNSLIRKIKGE